MIPRITSSFVRSTANKNSKLPKELQIFAQEVSHIFERTKYSEVIKKIDASKFKNHPGLVNMKNLASQFIKDENEILAKIEERNKKLVPNLYHQNLDINNQPSSSPAESISTQLSPPSAPRV